MTVPNLTFIILPISEIQRESQIYKSRSRDIGHTPFDLLLHCWFVGLVVNLHTKFDVSNFTNFRYTEGSQKLNRPRDVGHAPFDYFCIFWFVGLAVNPHTKFDVFNFTHPFQRYRGGPKNLKVGYVTSATPLLTYFCIFWFAGLAANLHTKFEVSNFIHSRDIKGVQKCKCGSHDLDHAPFVLQI